MSEFMPLQIKNQHGPVQVPAAEGDEPVLLRAQGQRLRALHGQQAPKGDSPFTSSHLATYVEEIDVATV